MQTFRLIVHLVYLFLHGCGLHYNVLSGLSKTGNKRVNDKLRYYALPRKKTSLLEFIVATVSDFRFFMRLRTVGLITSKLKGLTKKLSIPSRYKEDASSFFNQLLHCNVCRYGLHYNVLLGLMTSV